MASGRTTPTSAGSYTEAEMVSRLAVAADSSDYFKVKEINALLLEAVKEGMRPAKEGVAPLLARLEPQALRGLTAPGPAHRTTVPRCATIYFRLCRGLLERGGQRAGRFPE